MSSLSAELATFAEDIAERVPPCKVGLYWCSCTRGRQVTAFGSSLGFLATEEASPIHLSSDPSAGWQEVKIPLPSALCYLVRAVRLTESENLLVVISGSELLVVRAKASTLDAVLPWLELVLRDFGVRARLERLRRFATSMRHFLEGSTNERNLLMELMRDVAETYSALAAYLVLAEYGQTRVVASSDARLDCSISVLEAYKLVANEPVSPAKLRVAEQEVFLYRADDEILGGLVLVWNEGGRGILEAEAEDLESIASLLVSTLANRSRLRIFKSLFDSLSEAIAVSRRTADSQVEVSSGPQLDQLVMLNVGGKKVLGEGPWLGGRAREAYHPAEHERLRRHLEGAIRDALETGNGERPPEEFKLLRSDGVAIPAQVSFHVFRDDLYSPPELYTVGIAREIEFRAEEHQRVLDLLEAMGIAYFRADSEGRTSFSNRIESQITGYLIDELKGISRRVFYADEKDREKMLQVARANSGKAQSVLLRGKKKDGSHFWGECDIRVQFDSSGRKILGTEGFYRDVTARLELQRFLNVETEELLTDAQIYEHLKADVEFHRDYLSSIGHQILSPLGSVAGTLENLRGGLFETTVFQDRLIWALGQVKVCSRLVKNLAFLDRLLRGEQFELKPVSMGKLAIDAKLDFLHLLKAKRFDLEVDDASLDRYLPRQGHPDLLFQVFINLLDNAIKYSLAGTKIRVRGIHLPQGPSLEITNRGLPVPPDLREKIFERRYRTPQARALVPDGTGLGLWLVRKIAEAHQATISCNELREGGEFLTLFRVTFPHPEVNPRSRRR